MAHNTLKSGYTQLIARLNRFPQGAPPSDLLYAILKMLFSEEEASRVALLPIKPFNAEKAGRIWKMESAKARVLLDTLAERGILVDIEQNGELVYTLPPPMAGFFEFSMMRVRKDVDQKVLSELFYHYLNLEDDFITALFTNGETQLGRVFVSENELSNDAALYVLDYERASEVIRTASHLGIGICYCRHKMQHLSKNCTAPLEICMTFNVSAAALIKHGIARAIDAQEGHDLLQQARDLGLVQFGENVRERVNFICNCCGCCCEALIAARKFGFMHPVHTSNYLVEISDGCTGCGTCVTRCPVEALTLVSANDPHAPKRKKAKLETDLCLGCGVCVSACPQKTLSLKRRETRVITPLNSAHRIVLMAIERGTLQNLLFDNRVLWSHRALAAVFGVILDLPPLKQLMASRQLKSRYLEFLLKKFYRY